MRPGQIIASFLLVGWLVTFWAITLNGGFMTGFGPSGGPDPHELVKVNWNNMVINLVFSAACLVPLAALWTPPLRWLLITSAVIMSGVALLGLMALMMPPLGIAVFGTVFMWFYAARSRWTSLKEEEAA